MKKRLLSVLLAILMIVSLLPTMAFAQEAGCSHTQKVTTIKNGETYQMNLSGKNKGNFTFEASGKNWNIKNSSGNYLNAANGKLVLGNTAETAWTYSKGAFSISEKTTQKNSGYWWGFIYIPGRGTKTVTTTYYLNTVTAGKLSTGYVCAELFKTVSGEHDYGKPVYVDKTNHKYTCKYCGDSKVEAHAYDGTTHKCVCGAYDPAESSVKISVDVKEKTTKQYIGWWPWGYYKNVTTYTATIKTEAKGVKVTKVQYQLNGGRWTTGTCASSDKPIESLKVKAWDNKGKLYEYEWPEEPPAPTAYNVTPQVQGDHGTATVKVGDGEPTSETTQAIKGTNLVFTATAGDGYEFDYWEVVSGGIDIEASKTNSPINLTMPETALTLKAHFKVSTPAEFGIIVEGDGHGTASANPASAAQGTSVTLSATPNTGYAFKEWQIVRGLEKGAITDNSFTMPSNEVKVKAIFEKEYTVEVEANGHGSASADVAKGVSGKEVNLTITPDESYEVDQITVVRGGVTVKNNKFTIGTADVKIKVTFKAAVPSTYGIIVENDGHGTAKAQVGGADVSSAAPEAEVTLIAEPAEGYAFKEWVDVRDNAGDFYKLTATTTLTMPASEIKVKAIFERVYNINLQTNEHGTVTATVDDETTTTAAAGVEVTLNASAAEGYQFKEWKVVSGDVTVNDNKFTMPAGNVTVQAVFEEIPETKTVAQILATVEGFPTSSEKAWVGNNPMNSCYINGDNLRIEGIKAISLPLTTEVSGSGDNFTCSYNSVTFTFNMTEGKLTSIEVNGSGEGSFDDTYAPATPAPETKTVAEILATVDDFPTGYETGWQNSGNPSVVLFNFNTLSKLVACNISSFDDLGIAIGTELTPENDNYSYTNDGVKWTFNMNDGVLESVTISGATGNKESLNGTYAPAAPATPTFKAVAEKDTNNKYTLTLYYDSVDHSGDNITVYEDGTENYLFNDEKEGREKWGYSEKRNNIKSVVIDSSVANYDGLTSTAYMFDYFPYAGSISGAEYLDVSNVTDMNHMFANFGSDLASMNVVPNVSNWDTAKVENMEQMFYCYGWSSETLNFTLDLSGWNVQSVTSYSEMFYDAGWSSDTWSVTIPAKTGEQDNCAECWYVGDGTDTDEYIEPADDRAFTVATPAPTTYIVTFECDGSGVVFDGNLEPVTDITVPSGTTFTTDMNKIRIGETTYVADVTEGGYKFDSFSPSSGTITGATTITVHFSQDQPD